jgi:hypothetical protein
MGVRGDDPDTTGWVRSCASAGHWWVDRHGSCPQRPCSHAVRDFSTLGAAAVTPRAAPCQGRPKPPPWWPGSNHAPSSEVSGPQFTVHLYALARREVRRAPHRTLSGPVEHRRVAARSAARTRGAACESPRVTPGPARPGPLAGPVQQVRSCAHPVRLVGTTDTIDRRTGEVLSSYASTGEPDGVTYVRCENRRASVCPSCFHEYKGDVWHVLMAGAARGIKDVPDTISRHPLVFATFTRTLFRAGACGEEAGPARQPSLSPPHRRPAAAVPARPAPLVHGHSRPHRLHGRAATLPGLLRLRRSSDVAVVGAGAVAPLHHHPPPPARRPPRAVRDRRTTAGAGAVCQGGGVPTPRHHPLPRPDPARRTAHLRRLRTTVGELAVRAAFAHLAQGEDDPYQGWGRWVDMLGFRGHLATKSRRYSVTLGRLRQARRDYTRRHHHRPDGAESTMRAADDPGRRRARVDAGRRIVAVRWHGVAHRRRRRPRRSLRRPRPGRLTRPRTARPHPITSRTRS